jgi:hypothetical protein
MNRIFFLIAYIFVFSSCHTKEVNPGEPEAKDSSQQFLPVTAFIYTELKDIDSLPITPLKIVTINGKSDSIWMKKSDLKTFAQPFLQPTIDSATLGRFFKETSFVDQTLNAITFSYDPKTVLPDSLTIKRWDVYLNTRTQEFEKAYIEKEANNNGNREKLLLTWKAKHSCSITYIDEKAEKVIKEEKMIWKF